MLVHPRFIAIGYRGDKLDVKKRQLGEKKPWCSCISAAGINCAHPPEGRALDMLSLYCVYYFETAQRFEFSSVAAVVDDVTNVTGCSLALPNRN